jgi:transmembrane sensor
MGRQGQSVGRYWQIERAAAAWLARRDRESWSSADEARLEAWLSVSTAHRIAFIRLEEIWRQTGRLKALAAGLTDSAPPASGQWSRSPFFRHTMRIAEPAGAAPRRAAEGATPGSRSDLVADIPPGIIRRAMAPAHRMVLRVVVTGVFLAAAVGIGLMQLRHGSSYQTAIGGIEAVPMHDGSRVTLNTDSGIRVEVNKTERRIELEKGEAFFEVAKDPSRPFVVHAGRERIVAVGTKFSVRRDGDNARVRVIVTEGRVRVEHADSHQRYPTALVSAGEVALVGEAGVLIEDRSLRNAEDHLSWRWGFLTFHERPLADAVAEFNRYNTRKIVIADPTLAAIRIGGSFRSTNAEAFVRLLADAFPIRVDEGASRTTLTYRDLPEKLPSKGGPLPP